MAFTFIWSVMARAKAGERPKGGWPLLLDAQSPFDANPKGKEFFPESSGLPADRTPCP